MTDLLVVSLGTTHGLRIADSILVEALRAAGASVEAISVRIGATDRLRRGYPVNDLVEAIAARRALSGALSIGRRPRAVVFSTTTSALLADHDGLPYAVRLDSPAAINRPGPHNAPVRALERRSLAAARLVIPLGQAGAAALPAGSAAVEVVPVPVHPSGDIAAPRERDLSVAYVPDPKTKGLALLCAAWAVADDGSRRLEVFGVGPQAASAFLEERGLSVPARVTFHGMATSDRFRRALRAAHCFIHAANWEDYGIAPLEALADGALLVTAPAAGPYEALAIARALDADLVSDDDEPSSLAAAINAAYRFSDDQAAAYQRRAAAALTPYSWGAAVATLRDRVLPALLDGPR
jgi:hypothetical protein